MFKLNCSKCPVATKKSIGDLQQYYPQYKTKTMSPQMPQRTIEEIDRENLETLKRWSPISVKEKIVNWLAGK